MIKNKKILIIAAHPDDEILGCGGTILKLKKNNLIKVIFMTNGTDARGKNKEASQKRIGGCLNLFKKLKLNKPTIFNFPDNMLDTVPLLKIIKKIEENISKFKPEIIFTHFDGCLNIDHQITFKATITACRPIKSSTVKKILSFEVPSSTEWSLSKDKKFQPNYYIDISNYIKEKISLMKYYKDEIKPYPHSRSLKSIRSLSEYRGTHVGVKNAEAFYLYRSLDK
jgi:N-acetylglucosamine malate deacetylase 1